MCPSIAESWPHLLGPRPVDVPGRLGPTPDSTHALLPCDDQWPGHWHRSYPARTPTRPDEDNVPVVIEIEWLETGCTRKVENRTRHLPSCRVRESHSSDLAWLLKRGSSNDTQGHCQFQVLLDPFLAAPLLTIGSTGQTFTQCLSLKAQRSGSDLVDQWKRRSAATFLQGLYQDFRPVLKPPLGPNIKGEMNKTLCGSAKGMTWVRPLRTVNDIRSVYTTLSKYKLTRPVGNTLKVVISSLVLLADLRPEQFTMSKLISQILMIQRYNYPAKDLEKETPDRTDSK
ncbi:hypothetical protein V8F33_011068 [Rhypophila sp. PSN 637]